VLRAAVVLGVFGVAYLGATSALRVDEASQMTRRLRRLIGR